MRAPLYIDIEALESTTSYTTFPFQKIRFSSFAILQANFYREGTTLIFSTPHEGIVGRLEGFFSAEAYSLFPTIVVPNGEHISGYGFLALLSPASLHAPVREEYGTYGKPVGSIVEMYTANNSAQEVVDLIIPEALRIAPKKAIEDSIFVQNVQDASPAFYNAIEEYNTSNGFIAQDISMEEPISEEIYDALLEEATINEPEVLTQAIDGKQDNASEEVEDSGYFVGYVLSQEHIDAGYAITAVNEDMEALEKMVPGQYGFITMTHYGGFSYVLGEGVVPEDGGYFEDYFPYTTVSPSGEYQDGGVTIQSYWNNGRLEYQEYHSEV